MQRVCLYDITLLKYATESMHTMALHCCALPSMLVFVMLVQVVRYKAAMQSKRVREYARHGRAASVWEKLA